VHREGQNRQLHLIANFIIGTKNRERLVRLPPRAGVLALRQMLRESRMFESELRAWLSVTRSSGPQ
jgi:hypothetical protein